MSILRLPGPGGDVGSAATTPNPQCLSFLKTLHAVSPVQTHLTRLALILCYFNFLAVGDFVVLFVLKCAFITIERVCASWAPTISPFFPPTWKAIWSATFLPTPGVWLPIDIMEFCTTNRTNQETNISTLGIFLLFGSDYLGQLASRGVRVKKWDMVTNVSKPVSSLEMFWFLPKIRFPSARSIDRTTPLLLNFSHSLKSLYPRLMTSNLNLSEYPKSFTLAEKLS